MNRIVAIPSIVDRRGEAHQEGVVHPGPGAVATTRVAARLHRPRVRAETRTRPALDRQPFLRGRHACHHATVTGNSYLGTSGFAYDEWKHDVFYPEGLKNREMLSYYSSQLSSVEINYTFRRFPTEKSLTTWREQARPGSCSP